MGVAVTPNGAYAYVANYGSGSVSVISTATNTISATVTGFSEPWGVAVTPNSELGVTATPNKRLKYARLTKIVCFPIGRPTS
ncbi:MAG: hypothetical protein ABSF65_02240 [Candidatus Bathyarchaeia archaeon]